MEYLHLKCLKQVALSMLLSMVLLCRGTARTPEGLWDGSVNCGSQVLPVQVVIAKHSDGTLYGILNSPNQGFSSDLDNVKFDGANLTVGADVPNNVHAQ